MPDVLAKIDALRADLSRRFPERERVIDGCLTAVLAGEHVLLVGPPGTAKSALVRSIARAFGGTYFERLLTKFSTPDEIFGPISLRALENDRFERVVAGKLPTVEFAFCDEVFKSSSAILNSLLTIMNERLYHNDGPPLECPLVTLFGASNELPEGGELDALFDRFLLRFDVAYLERDEALRAVLVDEDPRAAQFLTMYELRAAQAEVAEVAISDDTVGGIISVRTACAAESIIVSDRRWKRSLKAARASAWLSGKSETSPDDLQILCDMLWREPKEYSRISHLVSNHADPVLAMVREIQNAVTETARKMQSYFALNQNPAHVYLIRQNADLAMKKYAEQRAQLEEIAARSSNRVSAVVHDAIKNLGGAIAVAQRHASMHVARQ